jgi:AraC family transcriptional regulator
MGYARKRRLSEAAHKLANGGSHRLIDLALESGFESQAAFTRAFKRQFGVTPGELKRREKRWLPRIRQPLDRAALAHLSEAITMEPTYIERGDIAFVGLREDVDAKQGSDGPGLWRRFWPLASRISHRRPGALGVIEAVDREAGAFAYWAAVEVEQIDAVPEGLAGKTLEGGRFAVFTHTLKSPDIGGELRRTFQYIYSTWVPKSEVCLRAWYDLEVYDERFDPAAMCGEIDIYVPIM